MTKNRILIIGIILLHLSCIARKKTAEHVNVLLYYTSLNKPNDSSIFIVKSTTLNDSMISYGGFKSIRDSNKYITWQYHDRDTYKIVNQTLYKRINQTFVKLIDKNTKTDSARLIYSYDDVYFKSLKNYYIHVLDVIHFEKDTIYKFSLGGDNYISEDYSEDYFSFIQGFVRKDIYDLFYSDKLILYQKVVSKNNILDTNKIELNWKK